MTLYGSNVPKRPLRASGNLSYLDFIRMVEQVWAEAHPDVPLIAAGLPVDSKYPCIIYSISNRVTHPGEPKPRQAEQPIRYDDDATDVLIIYRQRFVNFVKFEAVGKVEQNGAQIVEELIELFEDFMLTYTGVFRERGLSEMTYERRMPDDEQSRPGEGVVTRAVIFRVTTEKIIHVLESKLREVWASITIAGGFDDPDCEDRETVTYPIGVDLLETE